MYCQLANEHFKVQVRHLQVHYNNIYMLATYIYIILKGKKETIAVKSQYDELLHDTIYLRINKPKKHCLLSLLMQQYIHTHYIYAHTLYTVYINVYKI